MPIQLLPDEVVNQIAAGEVVERPAHLLKELLENSLDAGAREVSVDLANGGRSVRVIDDGAGISPEDLPRALQRFATSKILKSEDLWNLGSFGFRGEALSSISAVSRLTLSSRTSADPERAVVSAEFGVVGEMASQSGAPGTEILVENLFENVPARLKFLKSPAAEISAMKNVVKALALSHPEVSFRVRVENELSLFYPKAAGRLARARQVLEEENLLLGVTEEAGTRVEAVFASPEITAKTSRALWFLVQNRWVQDRTLTAAALEAFRSTLMHGEFPILAAWIDVPPDEVDVNIHPTKSQVKFLNSSRIFRAVGAAVRPSLEKYQSAQRWTPPVAVPTTEPLFVSSQTQYQKKSFDVSMVDGSPSVSSDGDFTIESLQPGSAEVTAEALHEHRQQTTSLSSQGKSAQQEVGPGPWSQLQLLGQSHLTYLVLQSRDHLILIDQHAAHERVLYETLWSSWRARRFEEQSFLFPLTVDLTPEKVEALMTLVVPLEQMGIRLEQMGPAAVGVTSAPSLLKESALPPLLEELAQEVLDHGSAFSFEKRLGERFATMACHSAIRAGQALSEPEMRALLQEMDRFAFSSFCPHGRPVSISKSVVDIEKDFGRRNA